MESVVYQVTRLPRSPEERPTVIAVTSKQSAQRLIAALAEQGELARTQYKLTRFEHPHFRFMEGLER